MKASLKGKQLVRSAVDVALLLDFSFMSDSRQQAEDHYYSALDLYAEGKHEQAVAEYEKCLSLDPSHAEAMHGLARAYQDANRLDDSIRVSKRLVELDPDDILAHTSLSITYQKKGMIPEAEAAANQARILGWKQQLKDAKKKD